MSEVPRISVSGLRVGFRRGREIVPVVDAVDFDLYPGEMLALLGESGSGKSLTALALMGLLPRPAGVLLGGRAMYNGQTDLLSLDDDGMRRYRGRRIAMIFQEPMTSLNPVMPVGVQLSEVLRLHFHLGREEMRSRCVSLLREVEIPEPESRLGSYPHELSGGQRQRVMIAMALAGEPEVLIADEPTTAMDVTVQAQIMQLLDRLRQARGMSVLFITHNLALAAHCAQRCAVMYAGQVVELARTSQLLDDGSGGACHPYTRLLQRARPDARRRGQPLATIAGSVPRDWSSLCGCRFAPRCPLADNGECRSSSPEAVDIGGGHLVRCWRWQDLTAMDAPAGGGRDANRTPGSVDDTTAWRPANPPMASQASLRQAVPKMHEEAMDLRDSALSVEDLRVWFAERGGGWLRRARHLKAVDGVSLSLPPGRTLALVGESGCGKSTLGKALMQMVSRRSGRIMLGGRLFNDCHGEQLRELRRRLQMIFQDPASSLDPRMMVGESIAEGMALSRQPLSGTERAARVAQLLTQCGLSPADATSYPHQFSGGQRQRIGLARALAAEPRVIICDECTSALDVSVQAQILNLLRDVQRHTGVSYLFITHDLSVVGYVADRVAVMYLGRIVEEADAAVLFGNPAHPYTRALLAASPQSSGGMASAPRPAELPSPTAPPSGCPYHPRCPQATAQCALAEPPWREVGAGHGVRCHLAVP